MKTSIILLMSVILFMAVPVSAQFTLTQASFPTTGGHNVGEAVSPATFNVGLSGANRTWTFDDYEWESVMREELVDAATTPYAGSFPTTNRCLMMTGDFTTVYTYFRMAADGLYLLGTASSEMVMVASSEARMIPFPCTYQTNWTSVWRVSFTGFSITDSALNTVDGWGTLATTYGNNSTLRLFSHTWNIQQYPVIPPIITENVSYTWLSSQGEQMLVVTSEDGVTVPNFSSGTLDMAGLPQAVEPVRGPVAQNFAVGQNYPNPFNPTTALPLDMAHNGRVTLDIYDETGRLVTHQDYELTVGRHDLAINGADWATGAYFARVMAAAQAQTVKMQLVK
ncbi:MAG: T9SS type A sorting domain-containing protein [bacterium]|nr:T9SS type A sorting domain-containing protein [bacterium]